MTSSPFQHPFKPSIPLQIAHTIARNMPGSTSTSIYDPVPPYDMDDIESTVPPMSNDQLSVDTDATERANSEYQHNYNHNHQFPRQEEGGAPPQTLEEQNLGVYCTQCHRHLGPLTERDKCNYALAILFFILTALTICVSIITAAVRGKRCEA
jgi:hypothetical protein